MQIQNFSTRLLFFSLLFTTLNVFATEQILCTVTSDIDSDLAKIVYEMDQDNRAIKHLYLDSFHNGNRLDRIEVFADRLREGIILNKKDKYIVVRMHSDNFDQESGGVIYLDTLYSALSGERREYDMELSMDKSGPILQKNQKNLRNINFIAKRSKVLGVIGVEKVVFGN